jgi:hypothetical protein
MAFGTTRPAPPLHRISSCEAENGIVSTDRVYRDRRFQVVGPQMSIGVCVALLTFNLDPLDPEHSTSSLRRCVGNLPDPEGVISR